MSTTEFFIGICIAESESHYIQHAKPIHWRNRGITLKEFTKEFTLFNKKFTITTRTLVEAGFYILFILAMLAKCFYFQFAVKTNYRPLTAMINIKMYMASFGVLLIISAIVWVFFNKRRLWALFALDILLSFLLFADIIYFRDFRNAITVPVIMQIGLVGSLGDSILSLLRITDIIYVLDLPVLLAAILYIRRKGIPSIHIITRLALCLVLILVGFGSFRFTYSRTDLTMTHFDKNYIIRFLGILDFHVNDVKTYVKERFFKESVTAEEKAEIDAFYKSKAVKGSNFKGIAKGKNLIVVQVEALQTFVINREINGKEITPNLNKLIKESLYFDNFYYQAAGGKTSDAEFITNTSLYPVQEGSVYFRYPNNEYMSLPNLLKEEGYSANVFHAYNPSFYNRTVMYRTLGYDRFYSKNDFVNDEVMGWGVSDASFYRQNLDKTDTSKPFFDFMISLSSHFPFDMFQDYDFNVGRFEDTYMGNYIKGANYADKCLGVLVDELKSRGLYDDTVLVIYGDHYGISKAESNQLMDFLGTQYNELDWAKLQKVPLFIHYPGLKNGETISMTGGQVDILPTIANLFDLDAPYAIGKDLLNTDKGYALLRNGSLMTDSFIYLTSTDKAYDTLTGSVLPSESYKTELTERRKELKISDTIILKDALRNLLKK